MTGDGQIMRKFLLCGAALLALASCETTVPDSGSGVGFSDYDSYNARQAATATRNSASTVQPPASVEASTLDTNGDAVKEARAAREAAAMNSGVEPVQAAPSNPAPEVVTNSDGLSEENSFQAVSAERDIQADAALIAQNRSQYQVIAPTELPNRPGTDTPNIVEYAIRTTNPVGQPLYRRSRGSVSRMERACSAYNSPDLAQEAFLSMGGPDRDRKGLDPDGDGFACDWNPAPFRAVRGS